MKKVQLVELTVFDRVLPLASGYLQAYACKFPEIKREVQFEIYSQITKKEFPVILMIY